MINVHKANRSTAKFRKQKLIELKEEIDKSIIRVGNQSSLL